MYLNTQWAEGQSCSEGMEEKTRVALGSLPLVLGVRTGRLRAARANAKVRRWKRKWGGAPGRGWGKGAAVTCPAEGAITPHPRSD